MVYSVNLQIISLYSIKPCPHVIIYEYIYIIFLLYKQHEEEIYADTWPSSPPARNTCTQYLAPWYLYQVVTQSMLRTHEGKEDFTEKKHPICDCSRTNQMPSTD